jgi:hypothetical protein
MAYSIQDIERYIATNNIVIPEDILFLIKKSETFEPGLVKLKEFLSEKTRQFDIHKTGEELEAEKVSYDAYLSLLRLI